jgi:hypothetical protein
MQLEELLEKLVLNSEVVRELSRFWYNPKMQVHEFNF